MEKIELNKNINEIFNKQFNKIRNELEKRISDNEFMRRELMYEVILIKNDIRLLSYMLLGKEKVNEKYNISQVLAEPIRIVFAGEGKVINCLKAEGLDTLQELVYYTETDLLSCRNMGRGTVDKIMNKLNELGLHLGMTKVGV